MILGSLIASNLVENPVDPEIVQYLSTIPEFQQRMHDVMFGTRLANLSQAFLCDGMGNVEQACLDFIKTTSETESQKAIEQNRMPAGSITGYLPTMPMFFLHVIPKALCTPFNKVLLFQAKERLLLNGVPFNLDTINTMANSANCPLQTWEYLNRAVAMLYQRATSVNANGETVTKYKRVLVTRSISVIAALDKLGMISWKQGQSLQALSSKMWDAKDIEAMQKEAKAYCIHLTPTRVVASPAGLRIPIFEVSTSNARVPLSPSAVEDKKKNTTKVMYLVPMSAIYAEEQFLKVKLQTGIFRVTKSTDYGNKTRAITSDPRNVMEAYSECDPTQVKEKLTSLYGDCQNWFQSRHLDARISVGFDIVSMHHYFVDVESSLYDSMVWGIRPGAWEQLTPVPYNTINRASHAIDFYALRRIFTTRVLNARKDAFDCLPKQLNLDTLRYRREKVDSVMAWGRRLSDYELFDFMKTPAYAPLFGDVAAQLKHQQQYKRTYLKNFTPLALNNSDVAGSVKTINECLENGTVRLAIISKKYGRTEIIATNNKEILEKQYGKDWEKKYGTIRTRLYLAKEIIDKWDGSNKDNLANMLCELGILSRFGYGFVDGTKEAMLGTIEEDITKLKSRQAEVDREGTLRFKVADGYDVYGEDGSVNIYRNCDISNIIAAAYASVEKGWMPLE